MTTSLSCTGPVWRHSGEQGWHFLTVGGAAADDIRARGTTGGFGSVRVHVELGASRWATSVFPEAGGATYVLPLKAEIRRRERLEDGDLITVRLLLD